MMYVILLVVALLVGAITFIIGMRVQKLSDNLEQVKNEGQWKDRVITAMVDVAKKESEIGKQLERISKAKTSGDLNREYSLALGVPSTVPPIMPDKPTS